MPMQALILIRWCVQAREPESSPLDNRSRDTYLSFALDGDKGLRPPRQPTLAGRRARAKAFWGGFSSFGDLSVDHISCGLQILKGKR